MPKVLKARTKGVVRRFTPYDGPPLPERNGAYRGKITRATASKSSGGNIMMNFVVVFEAAPGDPRAEYDGYAAFPRVVMGEHEMLQERLQGLLLAVCGKEDADLKFTGDPTKFQSGDKQTTPIESIGGVNPVGRIVNVYMQPKAAEDNYPARMEADQIFPCRDQNSYAGSKVDGATDPGEEPEEEPEEAEDDAVVAEAYSEEELKGKSIPALRKILVEEFDGDEDEAKELKTKSKLIAAILEAQEEAEDEDLEEEDEDLEEEGEEEEEDDAEEEEEDAEAAIREELADLDRKELKVKLKQLDPDAKVTTKMSDDDIRELIVPLALEEPPF